MVARVTKGWDVELQFEPGRAIAANAQHSVRSAKAIIRRILDGQADDDATTLALFRDAFARPDFTEGVTAFREKRRPDF